MFLMWVLTVLKATNSSLAISWLVLPAATSARTSSSRSLNGSESPALIVAVREASRSSAAESLCQGAHRSLSLTFCLQGQCFQRQDLYLPASSSRRVRRLTKVG